MKRDVCVCVCVCVFSYVDFFEWIEVFFFFGFLFKFYFIIFMIGGQHKFSTTQMLSIQVNQTKKKRHYTPLKNHKNGILQDIVLSKPYRY